MNRKRYTYLEDKETSQVKTGRGTLHRVVIGTTNTTNPIEIYDGAGETGGSKIAELVTNMTIGSYEFNCDFANGLYIGNHGGSKITVVWN